MRDTEQVIYDLMDWEGIETIVYSEHDNPHSILGGHVTEEGSLINTFLPGARNVQVMAEGKEYPMVQEDEAGFYAALLPMKKIPDYTIQVFWENGTQEELVDPYRFEPVIPAAELKKFNQGTNEQIYEYLGAHPMEVNGTAGVLFAVWAPFAVRVSVVGDFNHWDGRRHPMRRREETGVFELFIPGLTTGTIYKFELKAKGGLIYLKSDPYANAAELRPNTASIVTDLDTYQWTDQKWLNKRKEMDYDKQPMYIYEVHLGSWKKPEEENGSFYNYRELAVLLADYVKEMGYTHVELMPVMEHPLDASWGYQVTGYYAATARYGKPEDLMYFMDYMHKNGIGVILDWVPAHFPRDTFGLSAFDGTCLYEHKDPRKGAHPHWGTLIYNYARPEVANFLIANAMFWVEKYHADGIRMDAVASMLYLDYGKKDGEWIANEYGGHENLDAIEFLQQLSRTFHKKKSGALLIAEESTAWPQVTEDVKKNGLGFDLKWNMGWMNDFTNYMKLDPLFRKGSHGSLTFSMQYAYSEKFILVLSHDEVVHGKCSMINKMPGLEEDKFSNLRAAYGFMAAHPGKKLLFMGQDIAQLREWSEERSLDWDLLSQEHHKQLQQYMKDLITLYRKHPALYELDFDPKGFEWMSLLDADHSIVSFVRKTKKKEETLFVICNFTPVPYENTPVAVPFAGKYKEIFNSDAAAYGGRGYVNPRAKGSKKIPVDGQKNSVSITIPPLGIAVFSYIPEKKTEKDEKAADTVRKNIGKSAQKAAEESESSVVTTVQRQEEPVMAEEAVKKDTSVSKVSELLNLEEETKTASNAPKKKASEPEKPAGKTTRKKTAQKTETETSEQQETKAVMQPADIKEEINAESVTPKKQKKTTDQDSTEKKPKRAAKKNDSVPISDSNEETDIKEEKDIEAAPKKRGGRKKKAEA